ncbi:MAG: hypothetical protein GX672_11435 [Synergistaceae bacterium]|nr:hypothetical protein [Synergistaceae bacterium]
MRLKVPWAHAQRNNGFTKIGMVGSRTAERWAHFNVICRGLDPGLNAVFF